MNHCTVEYTNEYTDEDVLKAREKRAEFIDALITQYHKPVIVLRVNYPGMKKTNALTVQMIEDMNKVIDRDLGDRIVQHFRCLDAEGPTIYVVIAEDALVLKALAIRIEETHPLGRCFDLDVYNLSGQSLNRQELGYPRRKCFLCENEAHHCVRARKHNVAEIIAFIKEEYRVYRENFCEF